MESHHRFELVRRDLWALASWPGYRQTERAGLNAGRRPRLLEIARRELTIRTNGPDP